MSDVVFPVWPEVGNGLPIAGAEVRAGGTDVMERRRSGVSAGPLVDLRDVELDGIGIVQGNLRVDAGVRVADLASDPRVHRGFSGLAAAAGGLATPQIRAVGTVGGNLLQHVRCWYYRNPAFHCYRKGGETCHARTGDHLYHACFDLGPCIAPHPSTLGMALLAWDTVLEVAGGPVRSLAELYGDGSDGRRVRYLGERELLLAVHVTAPSPGEQSAYVRAIARARAEWPLVEAVARLLVQDGTIRFARVAMGGVAPVPLRLPAVEARLVGNPPDETTLDAAAALAADGANPPPMTAYKVALIPGAVREALDRSLDSDPVPAGWAG